jgi:hypothetical protein
MGYWGWRKGGTVPGQKNGKVDEVSLSDMVNRRVDEELEGYSRAFERLAELEAQQEKDRKARSVNIEDCAA